MDIRSKLSKNREEPEAAASAPVVQNPAIQAFNDDDLVKELRRRGYEVKATKVIEL